MNDPVDFLVALLLGFILGFSSFGAYFDSGRSDCEKNLPRTEKCVQVWEPSKEAK